MKTLSGVASAARRSPLLAAFVLFSLISGLYWGVIASDRYVSEAHIYLQKTNAMQQSSADLISLLAGSGGNRDLRRPQAPRLGRVRPCSRAQATASS